MIGRQGSASRKGPERADPIDAAKRLMHMETEREAVLRACPVDRTPELRAMEREANQLSRDSTDLLRGKGRWAGTEIGQLAAELYQAGLQRRNHEHYSQQAYDSRSHRRSEAKEARTWAGREAALQARWDRVGAPVKAGLDAEVSVRKDKVGALRKTVEERQEWLSHHPEAARRLQRLDHELSKAREAIHLERDVANGLRARAQAQAQAKQIGRDFGIDMGRSIGR